MRRATGLTDRLLIAEMRPTPIQVSERLGVRELDAAVYERLKQSAQAAIRNTSPADWEENRRQLYTGGEAAFRNPNGGMTVIGGKKDAELIDSAIAEFTERVLEANREFCGKHVSTPIDAFVLTGGGALISRIRSGILRSMRARQAKIFGLQDPEEPLRVLERVRGPEGWTHSPKAVEARQIENLELVRGASALGGCSVYFE